MRSRSSRRPVSTRKEARSRTNEAIRAPEVRVIADDGEQLGIMRPEDALEVARDRGLDLVEVAPDADPPVCRILNYGKYRYEQEKRDKERRKAQKTTEVKEIRLKPNMAGHDIEYRIRHAEEFLTEGNKVRATVRFYGRQIVHTSLGSGLLNEFAAKLDEISVVETPPRMDGRQMSILLAPKTAAAPS